MDLYCKTLIALYQKIEQLESEFNQTPATVGEYYEQLNKK